MKQISVLILILSLFLGSCATYKRCNTRFPCTADTIKIITVRDSIVIRDTTIYIQLPKEYSIDSVWIPCPDPGPTYIPKKVRAETSLAYAEAWFVWPNIRLELTQKDTTIVRRLDEAIKESYYWKSEYDKINVIKPPEKYIPKIVKFFAWVGGICIVLFISFIALKFGTKFLK